MTKRHVSGSPSRSQIVDPPIERRRHMQAFKLWQALCNGERMPAAAAILDHPDCSFADIAVTITIDEACRGSVVAVGKGLPLPVPALPVPVSDIPGRSLLSRVTEHMLEPVANRAPVGFEAEFVDESDREIRYRAIALPCSSDGVAIDTVLGVISANLPGTDRAPPGHEANLPPRPPCAAGETEPQGNPSGQSPTSFTKSEIRRIVMSYKEKLAECMTIDGALAVALVDVSSGMALATEQGSAKGLNLEVAAAGNTNVLRAKYDTMKNLGINEDIEDILITLGSQIHMIRPATSDTGKGLFIYLALDKSKANLAMARHKLRNIEKGLEV